MEKKPLIAGNWKMHKTIGEAKNFLHELLPNISEASAQIFIAPPYTALAKCADLTSGTKVQIGAQNMSESQEGPFTGEISARMLKEAGARFVILGHSERREHYHESNQVIHRKLKRALHEQLLAILCVGETENQYEAGHSEKVVFSQLDECLKDLQADQLPSLVIAYEPIWAIGTGKTATPETAQKIHRLIRTYMAKSFGNELAEKLYILYGGSVKPENAALLLEKPDIDGALVGGASLKPEVFEQIINKVSP